MADCDFYDSENTESLDEEDEGINWSEVLRSPEDEWGSFEYHEVDSNRSFKDNRESKNAYAGGEGSQVEKGAVVEQNKNKKSATNLTRMELNDHKAGMVGLNKEKINQIIFEASKGSRFYENELKKERQVAERIAKQTVCLEKLTEIQKNEALEIADCLVKELEKSRDLSRTFVHIDMDAFYAAVEILDNPELRDKPMAVGSNAMLSTSNYPARRYGVRAAMPGFIAKKLCPELVIVKAHYDKYREYSGQVQEILAEYDPNFSMASLDEGYLDLTEYLRERQETSEGKRVFYKSQSQSAVVALRDQGHTIEETSVVEFGHDAESVVRELRFRIEQKTRLTASAGIAPNVMLAKVCSDRNKPNGQFFLKPDRDCVLDFVRNLPIRKISGIGRVSEQMLKALSIEFCRDLYTKRHLLYLLHSPISFRFLLGVSLGLGNTSIATDSKRKSIGTETTFPEISKPEKLFNMCDNLCQTLAEDLKTEGLRAKTVTIKLKTVNFEIKQRSLSGRIPVSTYGEIFLAAKELLKNEINSCFPEPLRLRLMGIRLSNFQDFTTSPSKERKQDTIMGFFKKSKPSAVLESVCSTFSFDKVSSDRYSNQILTVDIKANNELAPGSTEASKNAAPSRSTVSSFPAVPSSLPLTKHCSETSDDSCNRNHVAFTCPVCGHEQVIPAGADSIIELNKHIDVCLNKVAIREIVSETNSSETGISVGTSVSEDRGCQSVSSHAKKRKRQPSGPPSKKLTLHSFWSK